MPRSLALSTAPVRPKHTFGRFSLLLDFIQHEVLTSRKRMAFVAFLLFLAYSSKYFKSRQQKRLKFKTLSAYTASLRPNRDFYDVIIVGAGPSGLASAIHLARQGVKVLVLERNSAGDGSEMVVPVFSASAAQLKVLGVYYDLLDKAEAHPVSHFSLHGQTESYEGGVTKGGMMCVKRRVLTAALVAAAEKAGVAVQMETTVVFAELDDEEESLWSVQSQDGAFYKARAVVCADGAESALGRKLGLVDAKPNALCTWAYVKAGTHHMGMRDMEVIQPPDFPGFVLLSRLPRDEICVSIYIRPGNTIDVQTVQTSILKIPLLQEALGPKAVLSSFSTIPLRIEPLQRIHGGTFSDQLLVVGQASGYGNIFSSESLQFSLLSARIASDILCEGFMRDDLSADALSVFQDRCVSDFQHKLWWSKFACVALTNTPSVVDIFVRHLLKTRKDGFMFWLEFLGGAKPPSVVLNPGMLGGLFACVFDKRSRSSRAERLCEKDDFSK